MVNRDLLLKNASKKLMVAVIHSSSNVFTTVSPITSNVVSITYDRLNLPLTPENKPKYEEAIKKANIKLNSALLSDLLSSRTFTCFGKTSTVSSPNSLQLAILDAKNKNNENIINNNRAS
jgi:hypothetical protein